MKQTLDKKNGVNSENDQPKKVQRFKITTVLHTKGGISYVVLFY